MDIIKEVIDKVSLVFLIVGFFSFSYFNDYAGDAQFIGYLGTIAIGLLAFVGIFYPLVYNKDFESNIKNALHKQQEKLRKNINPKIEGINKIVQSREMDTSRFSEIVSDISKEIEIFNNKLSNLKVERFVKLSIAASVISMIVSIFAIALPKPTYIPETKVSLNGVLFVSLLFAFYYASQLVISWHKIKEKIAFD